MTRRGLSARQMADLIGVSHTALNNWLDGTSRPRPSNRKQIEAALAPSNLRQLTVELQGNIADHHEHYGTRARRVDAAEEPHLVPVHDIARASSYLGPNIHGSFSSFIAQDEPEMVAWEPLPPGHQLLRVDGNSADDLFGAGSLIQVNMTIPPATGDMVAALTSMEEYAIIKYYYRKDYRIRFEPVNVGSTTARAYDLNLKHPETGAIYWMHPVVRYQTRPPRRPGFRFD